MMTQYVDSVGGVRGAIRYMRDAMLLVSYADGLLVWDAQGKIVACGEYHDLHAQPKRDKYSCKTVT